MIEWKEWQYKCATSFQEVMAAGEVGWELVAAVCDNGNYTKYYLKREKDDD